MIINTDTDLYIKLRAKFVSTLPNGTPVQAFDMLFKKFLEKHGASIQLSRTRFDPNSFYATDYLGIVPGEDKIVIDDDRVTWFLLKCV